MATSRLYYAMAWIILIGVVVLAVVGSNAFTAGILLGGFAGVAIFLAIALSQVYESLAKQEQKEIDKTIVELEQYANEEEDM